MFFFFKQKTAYELRISDWSSDVCSSDLEFLLRPVETLGLAARIHGVRYPDEARQAIARAGAEYAGWLPNHLVPDLFARFRVTVQTGSASCRERGCQYV